MAYNEALAQRVRNRLSSQINYTEKKMFGGLCFLINRSMLCGVIKDNLVVRVAKDHMDELLAKPHVKPMDFTGKPLNGFLYVTPPGVDSDTSLDRWLERSIDFVSNAIATKRTPVR